MNALAKLEPLSELRVSGLTVTLDAGRLIVSPASSLNGSLRQILRDQRSLIVATLKAEANEVASLVHQCGDTYGFTDAEHAEALAIALGDPVVALECYRSIRSWLVQ
jgi:hypothetical protein